MASRPLLHRRAAPDEPYLDDPRGPAHPRRPAFPAPAAIQQFAVPPGTRRSATRRTARAAVPIVIVVAVAIVMVWAISNPLLAGASEALLWLEAHNRPAGRAIVTVALATGGALALVVAWARATAPRRPVRLADGHGTIAVEEIERRLEALWLERPDVIDARAAVENRHRHGIRVAARIAVTADARLHETATAAADGAGMLVERHLGLELTARPRIALHYRELDLRAGRAHDFRTARARTGSTGSDPAR